MIRGMGVCPTCKKVFVKRYPKQKFCSLNCFYNYKKVTVTCPNCGKKFVTTKNDKKRFCSSKCYHEYFKKHNLCKGPRIKVTCLNCGKTFEVLPSIYKREKRKFCSSECFYAYKRKHKHKLGQAFDKHDNYILENMKHLEKSGYKCVPIGLRRFPKPDIIAVKNNELTAVEIDIYTNSKKKVEQYKKFFDNVKVVTIPIYSQPSV